MRRGTLRAERDRAFVSMPFRFHVEIGPDYAEILLWVGFRIWSVSWERA